MYKILRLSLFLFLLQVSFSSAATIYIDPGVATLNRGDAITAAVRIMPDKEAGECINVIDAVITYTDNIQPVDISIGKSIFNVWVESPQINTVDKTITFAGGIPNGYCGRVEGDPRLTNIVAEIIFRSPGFQIGGSDDSEVVIDFAPETQALLNDGQGTQAPLRMIGATYTLDSRPGAELVDDWRASVQGDDLPPEQFSITLTKDETTFSGRNYIVFSTIDKQTGISHYEVMEEPVLQFGDFNWGGVGVPWIRVDGNVYQLRDQSLNSVIRVKAIDKAGNEYIATLIPDESLQTLSRNSLYSYLVFAGVGALVIGVLVFAVVFFKRRRVKGDNDLENNIE
jgi:hypothetical protein